MTREAFVDLVERLIETIPEEFSGRVENLTIQVEDWADASLLKEAGLDDPRDLLGYYQGWPLTERGYDYAYSLPDLISLFQAAIENHAAESALPVERVVRETILHELGHYFGFDEEQMDRIEDLWAGESAP